MLVLSCLCIVFAQLQSHKGSFYIIILKSLSLTTHFLRKCNNSHNDYVLTLYPNNIITMNSIFSVPGYIEGNVL